MAYADDWQIPTSDSYHESNVNEDLKRWFCNEDITGMRLIYESYLTFIDVCLRQLS